MPRFHLEFTGPDGLSLFDAQGTDLSALEFAQAEVRLAIRTVLRDAKSAPAWSGWTASIRSADGKELAVIPFAMIGAKAA